MRLSRCTRDELLQLFQEMREAEVSPTEASFNIAISACAKGRKAAEAAVQAAALAMHAVIGGNMP